jgi:hypothetical protein
MQKFLPFLSEPPDPRSFARNALLEGLVQQQRLGASVDLATCTPRGPGADALCSVWSDPDFDPDTPAFYYARVVENPTCRWSTRVCNAHAVDCSRPDSVPSELAACCDPGHRRTIQERAWTSPIWYTPESGAAERAS